MINVQLVIFDCLQSIQPIVWFVTTRLECVQQQELLGIFTLQIWFDKLDEFFSKMQTLADYNYLLET